MGDLTDASPASIDAERARVPREGLGAAILACLRLENDSRLEGKIRFGGRQWEFFVNDRLIAPNREATLQALDPEFQALFQKLFSGGRYSLRYNLDDPRRLFSASVETADAFTPDALLQNLLS